jgi:hypothetical protein
MTGVERWEPGDVVLAGDGSLYTRAEQHDVAQGWPWANGAEYVPVAGVCPAPEGAVEEDYPQRPLVLLVRNGRPVVTDPSGFCFTVLQPIAPGTVPLVCALLAGHGGEHRDRNGTAWDPAITGGGWESGSCQ